MNSKSDLLEPVQLEKLRRLNSCMVANAIETFGVRLRNSGFADFSVRCMFEDFPPTVGYAVTARVRSSEPPMGGARYYYRLDWLDHLLKIPPPRILVLEDLDSRPGVGAFIGDVHANILATLGCIAVVTNGAVRDLPAARELNFQLYAGSVSLSHAFAHILDFGKPIIVGHMEVRPGDLMHGDLHGIQTIPHEIADKVPAVAIEMMQQEQEIIQLSRSNDFTVERLRVSIEALRQKREPIK